MATTINLTVLDETTRRFIQQTLELTNTTTNDINECFNVDETAVHVPFAFGNTLLTTTPPINDSSSSSSSSINEECSSLIINETTEWVPRFTGVLTPDQQRLFDSSLIEIMRSRSLIIASYPGFGKTILAIKIACELKRKTLIVVNKLILIDQWIESIEKFTDDDAHYKKKKPTIITATNDVDFTSSSFFIVNAINIGKRPRSFWTAIDCVIVDELHQIITTVNSKNLLRLSPRYLLGLSATPYRFDEYDKAIEWFFGKTMIGKELNRKHIVYYLSTGFVPNVQYTKMGIDWNEVLNSQMLNDRRNDMIVNCIAQNVDRTWLILVKRVAHAEILVNKFMNRQMKCATLLRSQLTFDKSCKILIGTTSKIGVGFDHAAINALCIAADVKNYFVQFLGRCMRTESVKPIVLDFSDNFGPLRKHFEERVVEYKKHGGTVSEYKM